MPINPNGIQWDTPAPQQSRAADPIIRPAQGPTPAQQAAEARAQSGEGRAQEDQAIQRQEVARSQGKDFFDQSSKLRNEFGGLSFVKEYPTVARQYAYGLETSDTPSGDQALIVAYAKMLDPGSVVREAEFDTTAQADSALGRAVSRLGRELGWEGGGRLSPEARNKVRQEMRTLVQQYDQQYREARDLYTGYADTYGFDPNLVIGNDYSQTYADTVNSYWDEQANPDLRMSDDDAIRGGAQIRWGDQTDPEKGFDRLEYLQDNYGVSASDEAKLATFFNSQSGNNITPDLVRSFYEANNIPLPDQAGIDKLVADVKAGASFGGFDTNAAQQEYERGLDGYLSANDIGQYGHGELATQGATFGFADEILGAAEGVKALSNGESFGTGYAVGRDAQRLNLDRAREQTGATGVAAEVAGGLLTGGIRAAPAIGRAATLASRGRVGGQIVNAAPNAVKAASVDGAAMGALGGFGYGDGAAGSTVNALAGVGLGGALGAGAQKGMNALLQRGATRRVANQQQADNVIQAGQAEGVTVNRAMAEPGLENRVSGLDATQSAGPRIQQGMRDVEGQIEGRVSDLGGGGRPMGQQQGGDTVRGAGERFIETTSAIANRKYSRAEQLAGDAKVPPTETARVLDEMIAELGETSSTNSAEIAFLQGIRNDVSNDLSVSALRGVRGGLRKRVKDNNLTFGQSDRRLQQIQDAASQDISAGLTAAGNPKAARAFEAADTAYAARMQYIDDTLRPLLGTQGRPTTPERAWERFAAMAKDNGRGDGAGLRRFYASLDDVERADVAATFANELGRNNKGDFSTAHFMGQAENLSPQAIRTIFGKEGAQSIANLRTIAEQANRVTSAMNSRTSKTAVARNFRDWLFGALTGAGGGGMAIAGGASLSGGGMAAAGIAGGMMGGRALLNNLSARSLMSPQVSKWALNAPRTSSPQAIDNHMVRLRRIAAAEPALAGDLQLLERALMEAANDNAVTPGLAAEDQNAQER